MILMGCRDDVMGNRVFLLCSFSKLFCCLSFEFPFLNWYVKIWTTSINTGNKKNVCCYHYLKRRFLKNGLLLGCIFLCFFFFFFLYAVVCSFYVYSFWAAAADGKRSNSFFCGLKRRSCLPDFLATLCSVFLVHCTLVFDAAWWCVFLRNLVIRSGFWVWSWWCAYFLV